MTFPSLDQTGNQTPILEELIRTQEWLLYQDTGRIWQNLYLLINGTLVDNILIANTEGQSMVHIIQE